MSEQWPGGFITKTPPTPQGAYETSSAYGIWNLSQQAGYKSQGLWPIAGNVQPDAQFNYVTMLLHGDGTNGAQNNTFLDSSSNAFTITRAGNPTQGSFSPYGSSWSNYFASGSNYLSTSSSAINFGTGDFTIEWWVFRSTSYSGDRNELPMSGNGGTTFMLGMQTGQLNFGVNATSWNVTATTSVALSTWTHLAVVRSSSTVTIYVNGVASGSASMSTNFTGATSFDIGRRQGTVTNAADVYCSNLRIVTGTAVYTGNFTPSTTPLTAISGTTLLTCQSNRFIDNSSGAYAITPAGTVTVERFCQFGTSTAYDTATIGGSGYFDGSGDYLSIANNSNLNLGAGDFTLEGWIYPNTASGAHIIWSQWNNGGDNATQLLQNGTAFVYRIGATQWTFGSGTVTVGAWMHIAVSRSGSTVRMFVNGAVSSTQTDSTNVTTTGATVIGANDTGATAANIFNGYIAGFRQVKGTAVYTAAFTPPTSPPTAITNTKLLLNFTNGAIYDNAMMNDLETVGNAQISTSVKKYGTGSVTFDGAGAFLSSPNNAELNMGASSFTIEGWFYPTGNVTAGKGLFGKRASNSVVGGILFYFSSTGLTPRLLADIGGAWGVDVTASSGFTNAQWNHFAVVRNVNTWTIYINGTSVGSTTNTGTVTTNTAAFTWMAESAAASEGTTAGYLDDLRITKGYARYTTTFTPPTAAFPNTGPI